MIEIETGSSARRIAATLWGLAMLAAIAMAFAVGTILLDREREGGADRGHERHDLLFGADDDNPQNPVIQPAGAPTRASTTPTSWTAGMATT